MDINSKLLVKKINLVFIYYVALAVGLFVIIRPHMRIPEIIRLILFVAIVLPALFNSRLLPTVMVIFYGINTSSFATILPTSDFYYVLIMVAHYLLNSKANRFLGKELLVLSLFFCMSLIHRDLKDMLLWVFLIMLFADTIHNKEDLTYLAYAFIILTIFLCALFLLYQGEFAENYGNKKLDLQRSSWMNANVFGAAISAGGVIASACLTRALRLPRTRPMVILSTVAVVLATITLSMNASRGAFLSFVIPLIVLVLISDSKSWMKAVIVLALIGLFWYIYTSEYLDLLFYRIEHDATGDGHRSIIWKGKLTVFTSTNNILYWLIGIGQSACVRIGVGFGTNLSTHNDFLTAFIAYGIIGFVAFVFSVYIFPILKASPGNKRTVFALLLFLFVESFVLEPFFRGYFTELMFFMFVLKYAMIVKPTKKKMIKWK